MKFVIAHGAFGSIKENWFSQLQKDLIAIGQEVILPQFPVDDWEKITNAGPTVPQEHQYLKNWLATFEPIAKSFHSTDKLCFIGHSLGPVFILHAVEQFRLQLDSAIFVSPFMESLHSDEYWQFDHVNDSFYKTDFDFEAIKKQIPLSYVVYSDDDPYVNKKFPLAFATSLNSSLIPLVSAGHISNSRYASLLLELCKTRINVSSYLK